MLNRAEALSMAEGMIEGAIASFRPKGKAGEITLSMAGDAKDAVSRCASLLEVLKRRGVDVALASDCIGRLPPAEALAEYNAAVGPGREMAEGEFGELADWLA